jgi:hypothetical protein
MEHTLVTCHAPTYAGTDFTSVFRVMFRHAWLVWHIAHRVDVIWHCILRVYVNSLEIGPDAFISTYVAQRTTVVERK